MIPHKNGYYYFDVNDINYFINMHIELSLNDDLLIKLNNIFIYGLNIGKTMEKDYTFGRYRSNDEEEVLVFIYGFLKGIDINKQYKKYLYMRSLENKDKCFDIFFSKCSILEK
jgi:hypothetical protein